VRQVQEIAMAVSQPKHKIFCKAVVGVKRNSVILENVPKGRRASLHSNV